jgi:alkylhydroperoxidase family enzyme
MSLTDRRPDSLEALLSTREDLLEPHRRYYARVFEDDVAPTDLLELGRLLVAHVHRCDAELAIRCPDTGVSEEQVAALPRWRDAACFSDLQRAALGVAEKMPFRHKHITEEDVAPLREGLGEARMVGLFVALGLFDATCRLRLVFDMEPTPRRLERPASASAPLS